jgi:hypothetical protein
MFCHCRCDHCLKGNENGTCWIVITKEEKANPMIPSGFAFFPRGYFRNLRIPSTLSYRTFRQCLWNTNSLSSKEVDLEKYEQWLNNSNVSH